MNDVKTQDEMTWEERQEMVAKFLADFSDPEKRKNMVFVSNAPKDTRIFEDKYYR